MKKDRYLLLKESLIEEGFEQEINWQINVKPCEHSEDFKYEAIWVILNSGMKNQIAQIIWDKIKIAWKNDVDISEVFGHDGKVKAIKHFCKYHAVLFDKYQHATNKIDYLETLPFIGKITKYHLAKNLGHDVVKPDRHLVRIANNYGYSDCNELCKKLSDETGDKVSVVDIVLWRSANLGWV